MKMMIVGGWQWPMYEEAFSQALQEDGIHVNKFKISAFKNGFFGKLESKCSLYGPEMRRINNDIIISVLSKDIKFVLFWRPTCIVPKTLLALKAHGVRIASYNNDDPFNMRLDSRIRFKQWLHWYWYKKCVAYFDYNFVYRDINKHELLKCGARHAETLIPYFIPWRDKPLPRESVDVRYYCDVVFVGHYEDDGRDLAIQALIDAGLKVNVWGNKTWIRANIKDAAGNLVSVRPALGEDYLNAIAGSKICLCFMSKLNRDKYTRRCFEIPACGRVLLSERTTELMNLFKEDLEACFFSSVQELIAKAQWLVSNPEICFAIAEAGYKRVWADGHDVVSRARYFKHIISYSAAS